MRFKEDKYLVVRCARLFIFMCGFIVLLILGLGILAVNRGYGLWMVLVGVLVFAGVVYSACFYIYKPYKETDKIVKLFADGYWMKGIHALKTPYCKNVERALRKMEEMLDKKELINISKKQAEYLALQNQINPHFLYNTLEGIRSEAIMAGMDNVADMSKALGTFFRYTIAGVNHNVTLEDELNNVKNYYIIQQFRFGERLKLEIRYEDETDEMKVLYCRMPKLTLQPIIENSIRHGIEPKIGDGKVIIKVLETSQRLIVTISDNGLGIEEKRLHKLNDKLKSLNLDEMSQDTKRQGGIAVLNVNNRIKLLFGEEYGIYFFSTLNVGTDVVITLPVQYETL